MNQHITDHAKRLSIDMIKVVIQRMPYLRKAFIAAAWLQVDDVDGGDAGNLVHGDMVVADGSA